MKTMKKALPALLLALLPGLALAAGEHQGGHNMADMHKGHNMADMGMGMHGSAAGQPGKAADVSRTIEIIMNDDMSFTPNQIDVKAGETVRFFVKNAGKASHELVIGSADELREHAEMMRNMPEMKHAEANMLSLAAGQRGGLVWQFTQAGTVDFACLLPGHMEAGMQGKIQVM
ncbi:cupredoxin family protein [Zobellella aerophila]|uniref:Cupredoxin family protein n=1 Tax=Zobellella aerophila TaxID=870480 RepID=A0ABP6V4Q5_9GAMM